MTNLTLWVLLMPLLGFIILGLIGRALPHRGILAVALGASGLAFIIYGYQLLLHVRHNTNISTHERSSVLYMDKFWHNGRYCSP